MGIVPLLLIHRNYSTLLKFVNANILANVYKKQRKKHCKIVLLSQDIRLTAAALPGLSNIASAITKACSLYCSRTEVCRQIIIPYRI